MRENSARLFAAVYAHTLTRLLKRRSEVIAAPTLSVILEFALLPYGLMLYGGALQFHVVVVTALVATSTLSAALAAAVLHVVELRLGLLDQILQVPLPRYIVLIARALAAVTAALPPAVLSVLLSWAYVPVTVTFVAVSLVASILAGLSLVGLASLVGSLSKDISRASFAVSLASSALTLLSPVYFPLSVLPRWLAALMLFNPLTPAIELARSVALSGALDVTSAVALPVSSVVWLTAGIVALKRRIEEA